MRDVVLVGDSIRMRYQAFVQRELEGSASVWGPDENGGTSQNVLDHLDEWVLSRRADVIHINAGLHDIRLYPDATVNNVPLDKYRSNVELVLKTVVEKTGARLIWATTTPVNQQWHNEGNVRKGFKRLEADVVAYNEASTEIARNLGIEINDLFQLVTDAGPGRLWMPDGVHFNEQGSALLGKAVADFVLGS